MKIAILLFSALLLAPLVTVHAAGGGRRLEPFEPAKGEKLINYHPHFQWRGPEMTLDYQPECEIQIATEPDFKKLLATDVIGGGMNRFYSIVSLTEQREYFWRVRIQKPEIGPWSETFKFTVVAPEKQLTIAKGSDNADYVVFAFQQPFPNLVWRADLAMLYDVQGGVFIQPTLRWKPNGAITIDAFYNYLNGHLGNQNQNIVGTLDFADEVGLRLAYQF